MMAAVAERPRTTPYAVAARELLRDTLLDAAAELLRTRPWPAVTMAEVADEAGVSRQTLYKELGSRHELEQALVLREVDRFLDAVDAAVAPHRDRPEAALSAAFAGFLAAAAEHPIVGELLSGQRSDDLLPVITSHGDALLDRAVQRLGATIGQSWPTVEATEARWLAESAGRLAVSYVALPSSPAGLDADAIASMLAPWMARVLGGEPGSEPPPVR